MESVDKEKKIIDLENLLVKCGDSEEILEDEDELSELIKSYKTKDCELSDVDLEIVNGGQRDTIWMRIVSQLS